MALPENVRETAAWKLAMYCERRVPQSVRDHIQLQYRFRGNSVTLFERRPALLEPGIWTEFAVAQFRFDPGTSRWTLYCRDRNGRWHGYDKVDASSDLADLLREVDEDSTGIFWG
jgi:hypothetical protein